MKRFFDILLSALGLAVLSPVFLGLYFLVRLGSRGSGFYVQERIGKDGKPFGLYKFRSMRTGADAEGLLTVGPCDARITPIGRILRRYKLDELPQLWNVFRGDMSIVGPRPEVRKYVELYTDEQRRVLTVRPGITDYASIKYADESSLLAQTDSPDRVYIEQIMPDKIRLNMEYLEHYSLKEYFKIIFLTLKRLMP